MNFLRDNIWEFVGVVLALITASLSALWTWRRRELKELTRMWRVSSLLEVGSKVQAEISITFRGLPVRSLKLQEVGFVNTGNRPIARADFDQPIRISFGEKAQVLSWRISASRPLELPIQLLEEHVEGATVRTVSIEPLLLNAGDGFSIEFLVEGDAFLETLCRISGVARIRESAMGADEQDKIDIVFSFVPVLAGALVIAAGVIVGIDPVASMVSAFVVSISVGFLLFGRSNRVRFRRNTFLPTRGEVTNPSDQRD